MLLNMGKTKTTLKKKNTYGESYRIKDETIALIDRINPKDIPFNTKLFEIVENYAKLTGVRVGK